MQININQVIQTIPETTERVHSIEFDRMLCRPPLEDSLLAQSAEHTQAIPAWTVFNINIKIMKGRGFCERETP